MTPLAVTTGELAGWAALAGGMVLSFLYSGLETGNREARHLGLGIRPSHGIGVDDRDPEVSGCHEGLERIGAADLGSHHRIEGSTGVVGHDLDRPRHVGTAL